MKSQIYELIKFRLIFRMRLYFPNYLTFLVLVYILFKMFKHIFKKTRFFHLLIKILKLLSIN